MVPMLTCGLVRSNFAFATGVLLWTVFSSRPARRTVLSSLSFLAQRAGAALRTLSTARARAIHDGPHVPQRIRLASRAGGLSDDLLRHVLRNFGVGVELHAVARPALRLGPEVADVAEHLRQRHHSLDEASAGALLHGLDDATAGVEVPDDVAHVVLRGGDLDGHHRLEERGVGLAGRLLHHHRTGDLE